MKESWNKYEPSPIEHFHSLLLKYFHEFRTNNDNYDSSEVLSVKLDGSDFNKIIVKAKKEVYEKYKGLRLNQAIEKKLLEKLNLEL